MLVVKLVLLLSSLVGFVDADGTATFATVGNKKVNAAAGLPGTSSAIESNTDTNNPLDITKIVYEDDGITHSYTVQTASVQTASGPTKSDVTTVYATKDRGIGAVVANYNGDRVTASITTDDDVSIVTTQPDGTVQVVTTLISDFPDEADVDQDQEENVVANRKLVGGATSILRGAGIDFMSSVNEQVKIGNKAVLRKMGEGQMQAGAVMDILVVYTRKASCAAINDPGCGPGNGSTLEEVIELAETETNIAYENSGISTRIKIVKMFEDNTGYSEAAGFSAALNAIRETNDGKLDYVHAMRDSCGADLVALIIEHSQYCGMAYLGPAIHLGFSVTSRNCATGYYSFGHEIGHNLGCYHDRNSASAQPYAHGFQDPQRRFRSTLAYNCPNGGCPRVIYYSNPNFTYQGNTIGNAITDNARKIDESGPIVAAWKSAASSSPTAALTNSPIATLTNTPIATPSNSPTATPTNSPIATQPTSPVAQPTMIVKINQFEAVAKWRPNLKKWRAIIRFSLRDSNGGDANLAVVKLDYKSNDMTVVGTAECTTKDRKRGGGNCAIRLLLNSSITELFVTVSDVNYQNVDYDPNQNKMKTGCPLFSSACEYHRITPPVQAP
mmetsp:Transcript_22843/g.27953  ORF Transcript_22843/g.27953 Transcript_22843/m.27953 type:complete len:613 (+) Transcript_22843:218-2056(+)